VCIWEGSILRRMDLTANCYAYVRMYLILFRVTKLPKVKVLSAKGSGAASR
jgi:hypothetical protein